MAMSRSEPYFMCSGAMVWVKLGRLVYGASNMELESILGNEGCNCSRMVFDNSFRKPEVLKSYFADHKKG